MDLSKRKTLVLLLFFLFVYSYKGQAPTFQWVKTFSTHSVDKIVADKLGNIYTAGTFTGTIDLDPGPATFTVISGDGIKNDICISKFDASGNFVWGKTFGAYSDNDVMYGMTIDTTDNIHITGSFSNISDFDPGPGSFTLSAPSGGNIYILKLDQNGSFVWAKQLECVNGGFGFEISTDISGNVYTTGMFNGAIDLDPGPGTFTISATKGIFISSLNSSGNFSWGKAIPCSNLETVCSIESDRIGNVYLTGNFFNTLDFDPSASVFNLTSMDQGDIFLLKLDPLGNFAWAKGFNGLGNDMGRALVADSSGNIILGGRFKYIIDFDPGPSTYTLASFASDDVFILKLDGAANFLWAKSMGESRPDYLTDIAIDSYQNVYATGIFEKTVDFDPGPGTYTLTTTIFNPNTFISKLNSNGNFVWAGAFSGAPTSGISSITIDQFNNIYTVGAFGGTIDFDPGTPNYNLTSGSGDSFIHKLSQQLVGINEFENIQDVGLYPNPNSGSFNIDISSKTNIIVTNVLGEVIFNQTLDSGLQKINLEDYASGIYFVSVKEKDSAPVSKRIVIAR